MTKYCPNCGKEVDEDTVYCNNCGAEIDSKNPTPKIINNSNGIG